jgi:hypothetical protein
VSATVSAAVSAAVWVADMSDILHRWDTAVHKNVQENPVGYIVDFDM